MSTPVWIYCGTSLFLTVAAISAKESKVDPRSRADSQSKVDPQSKIESQLKIGSPKIVDLGQHGSLFEIEEEDMLDYLMRRLNSLKESGKLQELEEKFKNKAKERVLNPRPVEGLSETRVERSFAFDPSLILDEDIKDREGFIIAKAGQKVNPLHHLSLSKGMVFIDGTKEYQIDWAIQHQNNFLIVLTNGSPLKREKQFGLKFYFDQGGIITKRYGIQHAPARLEQEGSLLRITEFVIPTPTDSKIEKGS